MANANFPGQDLLTSQENGHSKSQPNDGAFSTWTGGLLRWRSSALAISKGPFANENVSTDHRRNYAYLWLLLGVHKASEKTCTAGINKILQSRADESPP